MMSETLLNRSVKKYLEGKRKDTYFMCCILSESIFMYMTASQIMDTLILFEGLFHFIIKK